MLSLLNASNWFSRYGLLIVLVIALVILMLISFNRRKKEDTYRNELEQRVVPGAIVKTYFGLYGKVLKVTETTDGKIVLVETGEGNRKSYQEIHINAIYAIDDKREVVLDENGNEVTPSAEAKVEVAETQVTDTPVEAKKPAKKSTTTTNKKSTSKTSNASTTKKSTSKTTTKKQN